VRTGPVKVSPELNSVTSHGLVSNRVATPDGLAVRACRFRGSCPVREPWNQYASHQLLACSAVIWVAVQSGVSK
jgi:hypothetical protein